MKAQKEAKETLLAKGQEEWLTPKQVSDIYGLSISTLAKWRMRGINLTYSKFAKYIRYNRSDIEKFIESNKVEVAS